VTYLEAALTVLEEVGRPLTSRELANLMVARGLVDRGGKTPGATVSAALYVACRDHRVPGLQRLSDPGRTRARRGSVRWQYRRP
jgi:hypothetical protein